MNRLKFTLLTAALALATAFTLSCSDSDSSGTIKKASITGVSQKGPFVKGSSAVLYELNNDLSQTGRVFQDIIADDKGSFEIKGVELVSPYTLLKTDGYYRNELTGKVSAAPITLYAIADVTDRDNVNVNILTHLEYRRVLKLFEDGKNITEAKKQAQREILAVFGISGDFIDSEDMSIFGGSEGDAALLAISILLHSDLSEGEFSLRIADFSLVFAESGTWEDETEKTKIVDWLFGIGYVYCMYDWSSNNCYKMPTNDMCNSGNLVEVCGNEYDEHFQYWKINSNILDWGLSSEVPDFEKYVSQFIAAKSGLGVCDESNRLSFENLRGMDLVCKKNAWQKTSGVDRATQGLDCSSANEGEIKEIEGYGNKFICISNYWEYWD